MTNSVVRAFESALWSTRLIIIMAVIASLTLAVASLVVTTVETIHLLVSVGSIVTQGFDPYAHNQFLTGVVRCIDGYLLTAILVIFGLGLYELFIGRIEAAEKSNVAPRVLLIHSLDDLKDRLAKVVVLMLVIGFFQNALETQIGSFRDLLYLAIGTLLVSGALYLSSRHGTHPHLTIDRDKSNGAEQSS